jgi:hypothetical protein
MADNTSTNPASGEMPPAVIEFAGKMYNAARTGDIEVFQQALPAGLPPNMRNEKGDTLVGFICCSLRMKSHFKLWLLYKYIPDTRFRSISRETYLFRAHSGDLG